MGIYYKYHEHYSQSILIRKFVGRINVDDVINSWEFLLDSEMINDNMVGIISDLSNCELEIDLDSFQKLTSYLRDNKRLVKIKQAVVSDDPKTVVFPTLGEQNERDLKIKPFSTESAAVNWIINS